MQNFRRSSLSEEVLNRIAEVSIRAGKTLPRNVVIIECGQILGQEELEGDARYFALADYEHRFQKYLSTGFEWLNINLCGGYQGSVTLCSSEFAGLQRQRELKERSPKVQPQFNGCDWGETGANHVVDYLPYAFRHADA